ncbi:MAG: DUF4422 domain-containing protein [Chitinophagaceae bacterium]
MDKNIKILIAAHKDTSFPEDSLYLPIHVGKEGKDGFGIQGDDTGDNISAKNPYYSELTALYWAWKNLECDYVGLVHYRRYLSLKRVGNSFWKSILTHQQSIELSGKYNIILPQRRRYGIETLYSHYSNTHDHAHLDKTREIISSISPEYIASFDKVMKRTWGHLFNMFIMKKNLFDNYCQWLFPILFKLEEEIDFTQLKPFDQRLMGRVSEFLLDVWIENNNYEYKEINWIQLGKTNFFKKLRSFLLAKYMGKKYSKSM